MSETVATVYYPRIFPAGVVERGMWWMLKVHGLEPMYYHGMLKGLM
ncbi:hypothetical protein [Maribellus luteus]|nr:hypothetical protein [Maribellus luteus]